MTKKPHNTAPIKTLPTQMGKKEEFYFKQTIPLCFYPAVRLFANAPGTHCCNRKLILPDAKSRPAVFCSALSNPGTQLCCTPPPRESRR